MGTAGQWDGDPGKCFRTRWKLQPTFTLAPSETSASAEVRGLVKSSYALPGPWAVRTMRGRPSSAHSPLVVGRVAVTASPARVNVLLLQRKPLQPLLFPAVHVRQWLLRAD